MKKLFVVLIAFALIFAACKEEEPNPNSDVIGIWTNAGGSLTLDIADGTWILVAVGTSTSTSDGKWTREANTLTFYSVYYGEGDRDNKVYATARLSEGKLFFVVGSTTTTLTKKSEMPPEPLGPPVVTTLKINNQSSAEITDVKWNNVSFAASQIDNSIIAGASATKNVAAGSGYIYFMRKTNPVAARTANAVTVAAGEDIVFNFTKDTVIVEVNNTGNVGTLESLQGTELEIKNESFIEITDVIWQNVSFANTQYENAIKAGTSVNKAVAAGAGYVFFKRKTNPITARTNDLVLIEQSKKNVFTFKDDTVIVEANNPDNTGTFGSLQATVVWWDDAEGEIQPYYLRQHFAGYYSTAANLSIDNANASYFYPPKNGKNSIAIGASATSLLHLKVALTEKAKLSFWYANRGAANFTINNIAKFNSNVNIAWSFIEFELEPGVNDLIWKNTSTTNYAYFFIDDILIYYTE